jgi:plasmid maintenance system antidote protein VapI
MSASTLFDKLRKEFSIPSDAALARELDVTPSDISKARKKGEISDRMILRAHEYLGLPVWEIRQLLDEQTAPHQYHDNPARASTTEASQ